MDLDEATLVARARDRDVGAFEMLVRRYERRIYRLCLRMLGGTNAEAEDVTQEVFLTAWRRLPDIEQDAAFGAWLYRTATNRCLNLLRRRRPTTEFDEQTTPATAGPSMADGDPARATLNAQAMEALTSALAQLPPQQRACWLLREVHQRSYEEIAQLLGTTDQRGGARTYRAGPRGARGGAGAMAMNPDDTQTHTEHALPCGRSVEQVWEDMQVGRCTAHAADCPHCATARASLEQLAEATRLLVADPVGPPPGLLDRIMAAVRAELVQGEAISLPAPAGGVDISTLALAAVLRFAVDGVDGVRAHRCRIQPDPTTTDTVRVWMSVSLHYRSGQVGALEEARRRVRAVLSARIGVALGALDLEVADVWDDAATASEGWS